MKKLLKLFTIIENVIVDKPELKSTTETMIRTGFIESDKTENHNVFYDDMVIDYPEKQFIPTHYRKGGVS